MKPKFTPAELKALFRTIRTIRTVRTARGENPALNRTIEALK